MIDVHKTIQKTFAFAVAIPILISCLLASDQIPGGPQKRPIVIRNAILHTISGPIIEGGSLLFQNGKITDLGASVSFPGDAELIDAIGKHVYPGLIDSYSSIGLVEIDSIRATIDTSELGSINPNVRSAVAFNPDSEAIPVARANGILSALVVPSGGLISGRASLMMLDGWTWESMTIQPDTGMLITWPRYSQQRMRRGPVESETTPETDRLGPLHEILREVKAYAHARNANVSEQPIDLKLEAMRPIAEGKMPILVVANSLKQIQTAIAFAKQYELKMVLIGAADAMHCVNLIKEAKIPVVVSSTYRLPTRRDSSYDEAYALPSKLQAAGIPFSIASDGRFGASTVRNLPYQAATAAAFGLNEEQAIRSITLSPAEIFGVADRLGSLSVGKDATLMIADGNILETPTQVVGAYIQGRKVDLSSKHTRLNDKYRAKYKQ
ncbi:MAG: amidohydrolase family protein [Pirellula sp.]